jgi:hypothetical protein
LGERLLCKQDVAGSTPVSSRKNQLPVTGYRLPVEKILGTVNWKLETFLNKSSLTYRPENEAHNFVEM